MFTYMYVLLNALSFLLSNADTYPEFFFCLKGRGGGCWLVCLFSGGGLKRIVGYIIVFIF